eukprot:1472400-Rhodomonas_salina.4
MSPSKQCRATSGCSPSIAKSSFFAFSMSFAEYTPMSSSHCAVSSGSFDSPSATITTTASSHERRKAVSVAN